MPKVDSKARFRNLVKGGPDKLRKIPVDSLAKFLHCSRATAVKMRKRYFAKYARAVKISGSAVYNEVDDVKPMGDRR
jgi:hypothetical protein